MSVKKILDAISEFEAEHGKDPAFASVFTQLADAEKALKDHAGDQSERDTPGRQAVRDATKQPEPEEETGKPKGDPPKTLDEARTRAFSRFEKTDNEGDAEGSEPEPVAA